MIVHTTVCMFPFNVMWHLTLEVNIAAILKGNKCGEKSGKKKKVKYKVNLVSF